VRETTRLVGEKADAECRSRGFSRHHWLLYTQTDMSKATPCCRNTSTSLGFEFILSASGFVSLCEVKLIRTAGPYSDAVLLALRMDEPGE